MREISEIQNLKRLIKIFQEERNYVQADRMKHKLKLAIKDQKARQAIINNVII